MDTLSYKSSDELIKALKPAIIDPAIRKHNELQLIKAKRPKINSAKDFIIENKSMLESIATFSHGEFNQLNQGSTPSDILLEREIFKKFGSGK